MSKNDLAVSHHGHVAWWYPEKQLIMKDIDDRAKEISKSIIDP